MWTEPLITVGRASFTDWLVGAAGGVNVFGDLSFDSGQIGLESLIQRNPEVLIFLAEQAPFVKTLAAAARLVVDPRRARRSLLFHRRAGHSPQHHVHRWPGKAAQLPFR